MGLQPSATRVLQEIERALAQERRRTQRAYLLTIFVGIVALGLMGVYFGLGYKEISYVTRGNRLVDYAELMVKDQLPAARRTLESEIAKLAPSWAVGLSRQAIQAVPTGRKKMEEYTLEQCDITILQVAKLTEEQFRQYLKQNRAMLDKKFQELAANPTLAEASLAELVLSLEGQFQTDMKRESDEFLATLKSANAKIRYLHANKDLTPEQANEREVIMLFRRIQHENLGSVGLGGSAPQEQPTAPAGAKKDGAAKTVDKGAVKSDNKPAPTATPDSGTRKPSPGETKKDAKTGAKDTEKPKDGTKSGEKPKDE